MDADQLQRQLNDTLLRAERKRKMLKVCQALCYGGAAVWFVGMIVFNVLVFTGGGSPFLHDYEANPNPSFLEANPLLVYIVPFILLVTLGSVGMGYFHKKFARDEEYAVRRIVGRLFPGARCYTGASETPIEPVYQSRFFAGISGRYDLSAYSLGGIVFEKDGPRLDIKDLVVRKTVEGAGVGSYMTLLKVMFGGAFAERIENVAGDFRGLFASAKLPKDIGGCIVIFPDHLEERIDYLAHSLRSLRRMGDCKAVELEDFEFEHYFDVYATDEIKARYILTPAMMLRMTELRRRYNRDIMLSFAGDRFFFAVSMAEGFMTLGSNTKRAVYDLYDNIEAARTILKELRLDRGWEDKDEIVL
ncbi:MAG: DUF3137 domain-containing protein [Tannerellaceae bacterium]|jgi:hypothetical protein|nr:DUF3137 domain-containing protein [Tannerellaceae bacterium]